MSDSVGFIRTQRAADTPDIHLGAKSVDSGTQNREDVGASRTIWDGRR